MKRRLLFSSSLLSLLTSCGGGSPVGPSPNPTVAPGTPVTGVLFYDENANGVAEPTELVRLPGVTVSIGGRTGTTSSGGRFTVEGVPAGSQAISLAASGLPPYYTQGAAVSVQVPQAAGSTLAVAAVLRIGTNKPNVYLAYGDSITAGEQSSDESGYRTYLQADLRSLWGAANIEVEAFPGTKSSSGVVRLGSFLSKHRPAYTLILYGTNDWNDAECRDDRFPCYTINSLRSMIQDAKGNNSMPIVGAIPPVNPKWLDKNAPERNDWVKRMNVQIRSMAQAERTPVADIDTLFTAQSDLSALFADSVHPNDRGYQLIGQAFLKAITQPSASASSHGSLFSSPF